MNTYLVKYYTHNGRIVGVQVTAYTAQDAICYAERMPDFVALSGYPEQLN